MIQRRCIIAYFNNKDVFDTNVIKDLGTVYYVSEKSKYAIIYCDANRFKPLCEALSNLEGITSFEESQLGVENHTF